MATPRGADEAVERSSERLKLGQLIAAGLLIGSVAFVLLLGAVLHVSSEGTQALPLAEARPLPPRERAVDFEAAPRTVERPGPREMDALTRRVAADLERIAASSGPWTAQLALLCDASRARELMTEHSGEHELYLLPIEHGGEACFRICFGDFPSSEQAKTAPGLPAALRGLQPHPLPKRIAEVLEDME